MRGMSETSGKLLGDYDHLKQSIAIILGTPKGSRVMRAEFGSNLFELIDAPVGDENIVDIYAEVAIALKRWEPRYSVDTIQINAIHQGKISIDLTGVYLPDGQAITLEGLII